MGHSLLVLVLDEKNTFLFKNKRLKEVARQLHVSQTVWTKLSENMHVRIEKQSSPRSAPTSTTQLLELSHPPLHSPQPHIAQICRVCLCVIVCVVPLHSACFPDTHDTTPRDTPQPKSGAQHPARAQKHCEPPPTPLQNRSDHHRQRSQCTSVGRAPEGGPGDLQQRD